MIRFILPLIESTSKCDGQLSEKESEECCSESNTCEIGEGDCDKDSECTGNLVCGTDNCKSIFGHGSKTQDCCEEGETLCMWKDKYQFDMNFFVHFLKMFEITK